MDVGRAEFAGASGVCAAIGLIVERCSACGGAPGIVRGCGEGFEGWMFCMFGCSEHQSQITNVQRYSSQYRRLGLLHLHINVACYGGCAVG